MKREVVITGLGAVSPIGNDVETIWNSVLEGKNGIAKITRYDVTGRKVTLAGELKDFDPEKTIGKRDVKKMDRYSQYAMCAAVEAFRDAGIKDLDELQAETDQNTDVSQKSWEERSRWGVLMASGIGGIRTIEEEQEKDLTVCRRFLSRNRSLIWQQDTSRSGMAFTAAVPVS